MTHPIIETVARAIDRELSFNDHFTPDSIAQAAIIALFGAIQQPTESMWGGLARDIMMWLDMHNGSDKTPRNLFTHLERLGRAAPQWLRDEPEMTNLDHVPSKGTRCAIIYKAMLQTCRADILGETAS